MEELTIAKMTVCFLTGFAVGTIAGLLVISTATISIERTITIEAV